MGRELSPGIRERSTKRRDWKPGETKKEQGKRILRYRPSYQTNLETMKKDLCSVQFVIEKKGMPNLIALVSGQHVGRRVTKASLKLPNSEKNDIRYTADKYDIQDRSSSRVRMQAV